MVVVILLASRGVDKHSVALVLAAFVRTIFCLSTLSGSFESTRDSGSEAKLSIEALLAGRQARSLIRNRTLARAAATTDYLTIPIEHLPTSTVSDDKTNGTADVVTNGS